MWLQEESMPEELKPNKSHVVLWVTEDGKIMLASVDPDYPEAYKQGEMGKLLQNLAQEPDAKIGIIIGKQRFPLLDPKWIVSVEDNFAQMEKTGLVQID